MKLMLWLTIALLLLASPLLVRHRIPFWVAHFLTKDDPAPTSAVEAVIFPANISVSTSGQAIDTVSSMVADGQAKFVLMSCAPYYGTDSCGLGVDYLRRSGHFEPPIDRVTVSSYMTDRDEAVELISRAKQLGVRSAIVLVPALETRRLGGIYKTLASVNGFQVFVQSSSVIQLNANAQTDRQTLKNIAFELTHWLHIAD